MVRLRLRIKNFCRQKNCFMTKKFFFVGRGFEFRYNLQFFVADLLFGSVMQYVGAY